MLPMIGQIKGHRPRLESATVVIQSLITCISLFTTDMYVQLTSIGLYRAPFLARLHFSAEELLLYPRRPRQRRRRRQRPRRRRRPHAKC